MVTFPLSLTQVIAFGFPSKNLTRDQRSLLKGPQRGQDMSCVVNLTLPNWARWACLHLLLIRQVISRSSPNAACPGYKCQSVEPHRATLSVVNHWNGEWAAKRFTALWQRVAQQSVGEANLKIFPSQVVFKCHLVQTWRWRRTKLLWIISSMSDIRNFDGFALNSSPYPCNLH